MESRHLFTFLVVVETGSFTKAALKLDYAQSSITAQIQSLENELGTPLFDRLGKKIKLTDAGQRLLPYAQEIAKMHALAEDAIRSEHQLAGTLSIGAPESLAAFRLPGIIQEYRQLYPQVKIILKPGECWEMREKVRSGELDLAFLLMSELEDRELHIETLIEEEMALVACRDHPLAQQAIVEPIDLKEETILHTEAGCSYRTLFEQYLNNHGVFPDPNLEFWSIEAIKQCVISGIGISFLPLVTVQRELEEGKLVQLAWTNGQQGVSTQVAYHKKKWHSPALTAFLQIVSQHAAVWKEDKMDRKIIQ